MAAEDSISDMERGLIGSIIVRPESLDAISEVVTISESDFTDEALGAIWGAFLGMYENGRPIDVALLVKALKKLKLDVKWPPLLADCMAAVPNASHGPYYASHVKQASQRRQLEIIGRETAILATGDDEPAQVAESAIGKLEGLAAPSETAILKTAAWLDAWHLVDRSRLNKTEAVVQTGFSDMDEKLAGGMRDGEFIIVAGRPGTGKTAFAMALGLEASKHVPVLFVSLEMSGVELADRILSSVSGVDLYRMRTGTMTDNDRANVVDAAAELSSRDSLCIVDEEFNLNRIAPLVRQWRRKVGVPGLVIVDYLQLVELEVQRGQNRQEVVSTISRRLKQLAKSIRSPVVALSQLNRLADGARPGLAHLRESGALEQDANIVIMLWESSKDEGDEGKTICGCVEKNRNGATGDIALAFHKRTVTMRPAALERLKEFDEFNGQDSGGFY